MANIFTDNFESDTLAAWTSSHEVPLDLNVAGMDPGYCADLTNSDNTTQLLKTLVSPIGEIYIAFDFNPANLEYAYGNILAIRLGSTLLAELYAPGSSPGSAGALPIKVFLAAYIEKAPWTIGQDTSDILNAGTKYRIQVHFKADPTNGIFQVKLNGTLVINYSGPTTVSATTLDTVIFGSQQDDSMYFYLDNVLMDDATWPDVQTYPIPCTTGIILGASIAPIYNPITGTPTVVSNTGTGVLLGVSCNPQAGSVVTENIPATFGLELGISAGLTSALPKSIVIPATVGLNLGVSAALTGPGPTPPPSFPSETDIKCNPGLWLGISANPQSVYSTLGTILATVLPATFGLALGTNITLISPPAIAQQGVNIPTLMGLVLGADLSPGSPSLPPAIVIACVNALQLGFLGGLVSKLIDPVEVPAAFGLLLGFQNASDVGEDYETWVLTGNAFSPSAYSGWNFNSFALYRGNYYAAGDDGLYLLGGEDQDGTPIVPGVRIDKINFSTDRPKRLRSMRLGATGDEVQVRVAGENGEGFFEKKGDRVVITRNLQSHEFLIDIQQFEELSFLEIVPLILVTK
jgi:hypothetical protein